MCDDYKKLLSCGSQSHLLKDCQQAKSRKQRETISKGREQAVYRCSGEGGRGRISLVKKTRDKDTASKVVQTATWFVDSGAITHLTNEIDLFSFLGELEQDSVTLANGDKTQVAGEGEVYIPSLNEELKKCSICSKIRL